MANTKGTFTLNLETENLASWMVTNNTFTWDKKESVPQKERYWNGVLIQLGHYKRWEDGAEMHGFETVDLISQGQTVESIAPDAFTDPENPTWINVVVRSAGPKLMDPMSPKHLRDALIAPASSLDRYLKPYPGGITLWSQSGYNLSVLDNPAHEPHKQYIFTTSPKDTYEIDVFIKGKQKTFLDIDTIVIREPGQVRSLQQGSHSSPPQK